MRIISGLIESGTILSENKLAADFEVSRSPIREALRILASENIIRLEKWVLLSSVYQKRK